MNRPNGPANRQVSNHVKRTKFIFNSMIANECTPVNCYNIEKAYVILEKIEGKGG